MLWIFLGLAWLAGIIADIQESMAGRMDKKGEVSGARLNIKTVFPRYGDFHVKDKTVARPSYF